MAGKYKKSVIRPGVEPKIFIDAKNHRVPAIGHTLRHQLLLTVILNPGSQKWEVSKEEEPEISLASFDSEKEAHEWAEKEAIRIGRGIAID